MVAGSSSSDEPKITGMTPEVLSLSGRCEVSPWNILLPTWRFGYWISSRRWARSKKTITAITTTARRKRPRSAMVGSAPVWLSSRVWTMVAGRLATMPAKMISEMPLPTPRAVICSPSHIRNMVPPTRLITVEMRKNQPGSRTTPGLALEADGDAVGLHGAEHDREIAGVLVELAAAALAFLAQRFEARRSGRDHLHDDRGGDVGNEVEREDRHALDGAAGEHVEHARDALARGLERLRVGVRVDARESGCRCRCDRPAARRA